MTYLFLFLFGLVVLLGSNLYAQDGERVLDCLGYRDLDLLRGGRVYDLDTDTLAEWYILEGESIWINNTFAVPDDIRRWFKLVDVDYNPEPVAVWIWKSEREQMAYIFAIPDNTPVYENGGYAVHCCGAFKIPLAEIPPTRYGGQ